VPSPDAVPAPGASNVMMWWGGGPPALTEKGSPKVQTMRQSARDRCGQMLNALTQFKILI
jgi:hypothetical protein